MSRAAQAMQKIADEMAASRRRTTKKGRQDVDTKLNDTHLGDMEDVTEGAPGAPAEAPQQQQQTEEPVAKTSAQRSKEWRENQKKKKAKAAKAPKAARARKAAPPAAAGDKASVKAESGGGKINGGRTVFLTVPLALAQEAFAQLLAHAEGMRTASPENETEWGPKAAALQKIVSRLA